MHLPAAAFILLLARSLLAAPAPESPLPSNISPLLSSISFPVSVIRSSAPPNQAYDIVADRTRPWPLSRLRTCVGQGVSEAHGHNIGGLVSRSIYSKLCDRGASMLQVRGPALRWGQVLDVLEAVANWLARQHEGFAFAFRQIDPPGRPLSGRLVPIAGTELACPNITKNNEYVFHIHKMTIPHLIDQARLRECALDVMIDTACKGRSEQVPGGRYQKVCFSDLTFQLFGIVPITWDLVYKMADAFNDFVTTLTEGALLQCQVVDPSGQYLAVGVLGPQVATTNLASRDVVNSTENEKYYYDVHTMHPSPMDLKLQRQCVASVMATASSHHPGEQLPTRMYYAQCPMDTVFEVYGQIAITWGIIHGVAEAFSGFLRGLTKGMPLLCFVENTARESVATGALDLQLGVSSLSSNETSTGLTKDADYRYDVSIWDPAPADLGLQRECARVVGQDASTYYPKEAIQRVGYIHQCSTDVWLQVYAQGGHEITWGILDGVAQAFSHYLNALRVGTPLLCTVEDPAHRRQVAKGTLGPIQRIGPSDGSANTLSASPTFSPIS